MALSLDHCSLARMVRVLVKEQGSEQAMAALLLLDHSSPMHAVQSGVRGWLDALDTKWVLKNEERGALDRSLQGA